MGLYFFLLFRKPSVPCVKSNGGATISVLVTTSGDKRGSGVPFSDQSSTQSISVDGNLKPDFKDKYMHSNVVIASSEERLHELKSAARQDESVLLAGTMPTVPSATVPPHLPEVTKSTFRACSGFDAV